LFTGEQPSAVLSRSSDTKDVFAVRPAGEPRSVHFPVEDAALHRLLPVNPEEEKPKAPPKR
jgi:hypothetical protein